MFKFLCQITFFFLYDFVPCAALWAAGGTKSERGFVCFFWGKKLLNRAHREAVEPSAIAVLRMDTARVEAQEPTIRG